MVYHAPRDLNGDGRSDLLWYNFSTHDVYTWDMSGASVIGGGYVTTFPTNYWSVSLASDYNGDGLADLFVQQFQPTSLRQDAYTWSLAGNNVASTTYIGGYDITRNMIIGQGDFNGDGSADLLYAHRNDPTFVTESVYDWQVTGGHVTGGGYIADVSTSWTLLATGDFSGDGKADLLWLTNTGDVFLWNMSGPSIIGGGYVATMPAADFKLVAHGDFNGDGTADLLWQDKSNGNLYLWDMNGTHVVGGGYVGTQAPSVWHVAGTGDFNGDTKMDLLWQDTSGNIYEWQMNDTHVIGGGYVGTMGTNWVLETV